MRIELTTLLCLLLLSCSDSADAPDDAGAMPDRPATFECTLPTSAPMTTSVMRGIEGVASAVITWDGATCGVDSDDTRPDAALIVADVELLGGIIALPLGDWRVDEASSGMPIPVDTEITFQLSRDTSRIFIALWTDGATLTLTGFRAF